MRSYYTVYIEDASLDISEIKRNLTEYLNTNRMPYDPTRGIHIDSKNTWDEEKSTTESSYNARLKVAIDSHGTEPVVIEIKGIISLQFTIYHCNMMCL
jgi:hypothetical protein